MSSNVLVICYKMRSSSASSGTCLKSCSTNSSRTNTGLAWLNFASYGIVWLSTLRQGIVWQSMACSENRWCYCIKQMLLRNHIVTIHCFQLTIVFIFIAVEAESCCLAKHLVEAFHCRSELTCLEIHGWEHLGKP